MKDTMTYKTFIGSVHYSEDDGIFYGKLEAINDLVTFEGKSVAELKNAFREAVDDYIRTCRELGREPQKPFKGTFNVRVPAEVHRKAALEAVKEGISLNEFVQKAIVRELSGG
ncbi:MAG TPA: type II toxin-antitoxin system HicB family antitoxin [Syntrophorhabdales bacterium]|jgi:predicted HicB family RNase H-like nuclease|nr:type II toxin-antitoxin system HicB family antitoxin [Syntrophorhabdales bacterium]